jgi:hypothetical protein
MPYETGHGTTAKTGSDSADPPTEQKVGDGVFANRRLASIANHRGDARQDAWRPIAARRLARARRIQKQTRALARPPYAN